MFANFPEHMVQPVIRGLEISSRRISVSTHGLFGYRPRQLTSGVEIELPCRGGPSTVFVMNPTGGGIEPKCLQRQRVKWMGSQPLTFAGVRHQNSLHLVATQKVSAFPLKWKNCVGRYYTSEGYPTIWDVRLSVWMTRVGVWLFFGAVGWCTSQKQQPGVEFKTHF